MYVVPTMIAFFVFRKQRQVHNMSHSRSWFLFLFRNQSNAHNMSQLSNLQYVYISFSQEGSRHHSFSMDYVYYQCVHHKKRGCRVSSIGGEDCVRQVYPGRCTVGEVLYFLWGSMPRKKGVRKIYCYECLANDVDWSTRLRNKTHNENWNRPCEICMAGCDFLWWSDLNREWQPVPRDILADQNLLMHIYQNPDPPAPGMVPQVQWESQVAISEVPFNEAQAGVPSPLTMDAAGAAAPHWGQDWAVAAQDLGAGDHTAAPGLPVPPAAVASSSNAGLTQPAVREDSSDSEDSDDDKEELKKEVERLKSLLATEKKISAGLMRTEVIRFLRRSS